MNNDPTTTETHPLSNGTGHGRQGMDTCVEPIGSNPTDHRYLADESWYQRLLKSRSGGSNPQLIPSEHTPDFE